MSHRETLTDLGAIVFVAATLALALEPFQNAPFVDDWTYAWSVEHFLQTRELKILDWSTSIHVVQTLWASLFCLPFGFSFTALRLSTWVLSVAGLCGLYLTLRQFGVARRDALLGTAILGSHPVYFILSFTFMTDIPFLALTIWFCYFLVRGIQEERSSWLIAASLAASASIGIRLTGLVLPGAMLMTLLVGAGRWGRRPARVASVLIPVTFAVGLWLWYPSHVEQRGDLMWAEGSLAARRAALVQYALPHLPKWLVQQAWFSVHELGLALSSLAVSLSRRRDLALVLAGGAMLLTLYFANDTRYTVLKPGQTWTIGELGATEPQVPGRVGPRLPRRWRPVFAAATIALFALATVPAGRGRTPRGILALVWLSAGFFVLGAALWLFYDRYILPFVFASVVLLLARRPIARPLAAASVTMVFLGVSVVGTRDHLSYNEALWSAVAYLREEMGARASDIDGGYVVNGWLRYAHPDPAMVDAGTLIHVPWVNARGGESLYQIADKPMDGYHELAAIFYHRRLAPSGAIHVLKRKDGP